MRSPLVAKTSLVDDGYMIYPALDIAVEAIIRAGFASADTMFLPVCKRVEKNDPIP